MSPNLDNVHMSVLSGNMQGAVVVLISMVDQVARAQIRH